MPENIFDPNIHQDMEHLNGYKFRNKALAERVEELKKAPSEPIKQFLKEHPEYKEVNSFLLAEYSGLAESTLRKLKAGGIADPRGSTYWLLWKAFGVDPRTLMGIPTQQASQQGGDAAELGRLRKLVLEHSAAANRSEGAVAALDRIIKDKEEIIRQREHDIKKRNLVIIALAATLGAILAAIVLILWLHA